MRAAALALVAAFGGSVAAVDPLRGAGESAVRAVSGAWHGVLGERPKSASGQRMIVVLESPSLADRMARAGSTPTPEEQKRWVSEADAAQRVLVSRLAARGVRVRRELSFTRTVNAFSALLDPRAHAELERSAGVAGVYPVRTVYPASISAQTLARPEYRAGAGRRPDVSLPGFDGSGLRIALLDTGVELEHPYLNGRVLPGVDLVGKDERAAAEPKPDDPTRVESHGTRMAGLLVGSGGPGGLEGIAPQARVVPIRVLGWERAADGTYSLLGRGDVLLAGLERAVDPDADGDVEDAVHVALAALVEPYASFPDSPESRAVAGASTLGTLVVAPAGNDGKGGRAFGTVGAPGGAAQALTVGALDTRRELLEVSTVVRVGDETVFDGRAPLLGALPPEGEFPVAALLGPSLADRRRPADSLVDGRTLADLFDSRGMSRVAGRAAIVPASDEALETQARHAQAAGAAALLVFGSDLRPGILDLDETAAVPVLRVPTEAARTALDGIARREVVSVSFGRVRLVANEDAGELAPFSSGGIAFDGRVKPDLVAPGVSLATADGGRNVDGGARYATVSGSSAAAAVVAGTAAVLAQARPGLTATELRSLLVGSARQIVRDGVPDPVTLQGAGVVDPPAAAAAEVAAEPVGLAFGRRSADGWRVTEKVRVRNLSTRRLEIAFGISRDRWGEPELSFSASPAHLALHPGASAEVTLVASGSGALAGEAGGTFVVAPQDSRALRIPWAVSVRPERPAPLLSSVSLSNDRFQVSDVAPAVVAFRAGNVDAGADGNAIEPVQLLVAELRTAKGKRLGVLTRLHDLLPGRYAFGLTGRGPRGGKLAPGRYVLRLTARPVAGDVGAAATSVDVRFTISR
jgi:minor extracellular serine protease Vpr